MPKTPLISEAEWKVMRVLWRKSPLPAYDIIQELTAKEDWHPNTIKTLLTRLHKKKALAAEKYKNLYLYAPRLTEEECVAAESESLLDRLFDGAVQPLLVHFARQRKLCKKDLEELRRILEGKETK
ncbi:MAG TPA: BlaI/MecI/CopY family transcriptional regulator [Verrucomicrobiae bacterium]|nr:BlaI/MecI/CopY family transcriptional regulator [Verrucomicrobiae bacterium]